MGIFLQSNFPSKKKMTILEGRKNIRDGGSDYSFRTKIKGTEPENEKYLSWSRITVKTTRKNKLDRKNSYKKERVMLEFTLQLILNTIGDGMEN